MYSGSHEETDCSDTSDTDSGCRSDHHDDEEQVDKEMFQPQTQSIPAFKVHHGEDPETYTCRVCINDGISREQLAWHDSINAVEPNACLLLAPEEEKFAKRMASRIQLPQRDDELQNAAWEVVYDMLCIGIDRSDLRSPDSVVEHLLKLFEGIGHATYGGARNGLPPSLLLSGGSQVDFDDMLYPKSGTEPQKLWPGTHHPALPRDDILSAAANVVIEKRSWSSMLATAALLAASRARILNEHPVRDAEKAFESCPSAAKSLNLPQWYIKFE